MRIVSLISAGTEILYALGLGKHVVAVSHECDWPPDCLRLPRVTRSNIDGAESSRGIDDQVRNLLMDGRPLYEIDVPCLAQLRPDLIVTQAQCNVCAVDYADVVKMVQTDSRLQGARVIALAADSLEGVFG